MNRQLFWSILLIGGAILIGGVLVMLRPEPAEEERVEEAPLVQAMPLKAASGPIPVLGSGTVQARDEVTIGVEVGGRLTYVNPAFREGGVVPAGATLLRIDETDYRNDVRIAQADVAAQDVNVLEAEEEVAIAKDELERFAAREAQIAGALAKGAAGETQILAPNGMASPPSPSAERTAQDAESEAERSLATREPQLQSAKAARERARAGLADARSLLGRTRVKSPFRGFVREESAAVGSLVQVGQALGSIVATDAYEVRISLTAEEAAIIPGLLDGGKGRIPARVTYVYGGKTYQWDAFVDRANAILDAATRNIDVFLRVPSPLTAGRLVGAASEGDAPSPAPPLLLGAFVNAEIVGASLDSYAKVPATAVRPGNQIWVVRDGKLAILPVRVIQRSDTVAYIATPSLAQGGQLVVSNLAAPIAGMPLRIARAEKAGEGAKSKPNSKPKPAPEETQPSEGQSE